MSDDEVYLQWKTVNNSSRGLIKLNFTQSDINGLRQENHTAEGIVRYHFTVNVRDLGEGPLLLTLSVKLQCVHYNDSKLSRCFLCTCTQWQYEGESETIQLLSMKRGRASSCAGLIYAYCTCSCSTDQGHRLSSCLLQEFVLRIRTWQPWLSMPWMLNQQKY